MTTTRRGDSDDDSSSTPSPEEDDVVSAINYNTITSLAALKELLHGPGSDPAEDMAWFEHYFLHHVNRLPKQELRSPCLRPILEGRRLSESDNHHAAPLAAAGKSTSCLAEIDDLKNDNFYAIQAAKGVGRRNQFGA